MLVVPGTPGGEPAVMIMVSPREKRLSRDSSASHNSTISSVWLACRTTNVSTPQLSVSWLRVPMSEVNARIGCTAR